VKDGPRFHALTRAHGLADDLLQQMLEDDQGRVWFASSRGFFYVAKTELLAVVQGSAGRVTSHAFSRSQDLVGVTPTANYQPAAIRTREGRLWFATSQGAVMIDPARVPRDLPTPPVVIDEVRLDGRVLADRDDLRLPSGRHRLDFRFAALTYTMPDAVVLRHRLEGADAPGGWVDDVYGMETAAIGQDDVLWAVVHHVASAVSGHWLPATGYWILSSPNAILKLRLFCPKN